MHIMIDFETFGVHQTAPIISAGLAVFDPRDTLIIAGRRFSFNVDEQFKLGRVPSAGTLSWWLGDKVDNEARNDLRLAMEVGLGANLIAQCQDIADYIKSTLGETGMIWGYGANEDIAWLTSLLEAVDVERPWHYRKYGCYRTLLRMHGNDDSVLWHKPSTAHDPLADAVAQARTMQDLVKLYGLTFGDAT